MTSGQGVPSLFSKTPPDQPIKLPPTPPDTGKQSDISSVERLRSYWDDLAPQIASAVDEILEIPISRDFDPHIHEDAIRNFLPRFDCYTTKRSNRKILVRMPTRIHEGFVAYIEEESYRQLHKSPTRNLKVEVGRSSRVLLYDGKQSRQPDTQFLDSEDVPRVIVEVAYTQSGKHGRKIAEDYIFGTDGKVKRVFVCDINAVGKPSVISEWESKITESEDLNYEGDLSVVLVKSKEFRTAHGASANDDERLNIPCCDFAARTDDQNAISIQFRHFHDMLGKLEMKRPRPDSEADFEPRTKRFRYRCRSLTPAEELSQADEQKFQEAEDAVATDGSDYEPDSDSSIQASTVSA